MTPHQVGPFCIKKESDSKDGKKNRASYTKPNGLAKTIKLLSNYKIDMPERHDSYLYKKIPVLFDIKSIKKY
jgi:hypothetical protein